MTKHVCDLYQRSNSTIDDFCVCEVQTLDKLHDTFCMHMYGCELWNLSYGNIDKFKIAWRRVKRRIWKLPPLTHKKVIHNIGSNFNITLDKRIIKFLYNSLNCNNTCKQLLRSKLMCTNSCFADNHRLLSYRYDISDKDWNNGLSFLMGKVKKKTHILYPCPPEVNILRELIDMRDDGKFDILSLIELNKLIDDICLN